MRVGTNPVKNNPDNTYPYYHKIIVPVYIPELQAYFEHSLEVLKVCLTSLSETIHEKACICVVANGCCDEVLNYLDEAFNTRKIQQLIKNIDNNGKIDSILPIAKASWENIITISDADVLFKTNWIKEVEQCFDENKTLGFCSPCPIPYAWSTVNNNALLRGIVFGKLRIGQYLNSDEILHFTNSIDRTEIYKKKDFLLKKQVAYSDSKNMLLGAGHFVGTFHRSIFDLSPSIPSQKKLRGNSMFEYLDLPIDKSGYNRLATGKIFCHHIGNQLDNFIKSEYEIPRIKGVFGNYCFERKKDIIHLLPYRFRYIAGRIIKRILIKRLNA